MPTDKPPDQYSPQRLLMQHDYARSMSAYRSPSSGRARAEVPKPPKRRHPKRWAWLVILVLLGFGIHQLWPAKAATAQHDLSSAVATVTDSKKRAAEQAAAQAAAAKAAAAKATATFSAQVNAIITANPAITFSVSTVTVGSGLQHYGTSNTFLGASTTKLITAADYLHQVEEGDASLTQTIDGSSAEHLLDIMIVNSDDTAWADLNSYLGYPQMNSYAASIGLSSFDSIPNTITSNDIANLLNQLYSGNLLDSADRSLLLGYMLQANYRQYVVPAVPAGDTIYHKIGLYEDNVHDATIITNGPKSLVLVIYTNGNGTMNWPNRALIMQAIAKDAIADYL